MTWRVGRKVGRTIYDGDKLIGLMDTKEQAMLVVLAVNQLGKEESVSASVPHALQEKCVNCKFTLSSHIDGYCPDNYSIKTRFESGRQRTPLDDLLSNHAKGDNG